MKRLVALTFVFGLALSLVGCSGDAGGIVGTEEQVPQAEIEKKNKEYAELMQKGTQQAKEEQGYGGE